MGKHQSSCTEVIVYTNRLGSLVSGDQGILLSLHSTELCIERGGSAFIN